MNERQKKFINILSKTKEKMSNDEIDELLKDLKPFLDMLVKDAYEEADCFDCDSEIEPDDLDYRYSYFAVDLILHLIGIKNNRLREKIEKYIDKKIKESPGHSCGM